MSVTTPDGTTECDRCAREIHELEPVTGIQFSGGVDAHRLVCPDCIDDIVATWNEGAADGGEDSE